MGTRRVTLSFPAGDDYGAPFSSSRLEVVEGAFNVQSNPATMAIGEGKPVGTDGQQFSAGAFIGLGPVQTPGSGWRLDQTFWRNTTGGSNATIVFTGTVRDVVGVEGA